MAHLWNVKGGLEIEDHGTNQFVFFFGNKFEKEKVLAKEPWCFDNALLVLRHIEDDTLWDSKGPLWTNFWVQFHDLPLSAMTIPVGTRLGNEIGNTISVFTNKSGRCPGSFLRVRVKIDVAKPLRTGIQLKLGSTGKTLRSSIRFENLPDFCFHCGKVGHKWKDCKEDNLNLADVSSLTFNKDLRGCPPPRFDTCFRVPAVDKGIVIGQRGKQVQGSTGQSWSGRGRDPIGTSEHTRFNSPSSSASGASGEELRDVGDITNNGENQCVDSFSKVDLKGLPLHVQPPAATHPSQVEAIKSKSLESIIGPDETRPRKRKDKVTNSGISSQPKRSSPCNFGQRFPNKVSVSIEECSGAPSEKLLFTKPTLTHKHAASKKSNGNWKKRARVNPSTGVGGQPEESEAGGVRSWVGTGVRDKDVVSDEGKCKGTTGVTVISAEAGNQPRREQ